MFKRCENESFVRFTDHRIMCPEFFAGMREAMVKYAVWRNGEQYVGCGIHTLKDALQEVDRLEKDWICQHSKKLD